MVKRFSILLFILLHMLQTAPAISAETYEEGYDYSYYRDVPWSHWASGPINNLTYLEIIKGYEDKNFRPNENVSREQFAVLMVRALKMDFPLRIKQPSFSDVAEKRWSYAYVETVKSYFDTYSGSGGARFFRPTAAATRQDVAVAIVKALNYKTSDIKNKTILKDKFTDYASISTEKQPYVAIAVENNLINGYPDGTFRGNIPVTRAQAATILRNVMFPEYAGELGPMLDVKIPEKVTENRVTVEGTTEPGATVFINGKSTPVINGKFSTTYTLEKEDTYEYVITSQVPSKKIITTVKRTVKFEYPIPVLTINALPEIASGKNITVSGKVIANGSSVNLYLNNNRVFVNQNGSFSTSIALTGGENMLSFVATNNYGKSAKVTKIVYFDDGGPALYVEALPETTVHQELRVLGKITDKNDPYPQLYFNSKLVQQWEDGTFEVVTNLKKGENTLTFRAVDRHGKISIVTRKITFNSELPVLVVNDLPEVVSDDEIDISGKVSDINDEKPLLYLNNKRVSVNSDGTFSISVRMKDGINEFKFVLKNSLGEETSVTKKVRKANLPTLKINTKIPATVTYKAFYVYGTASDSNGAKIQLLYNGRGIALDNNGNFSVHVNLVNGENTLTFVIKNEYGLSRTVTYKVTYKSPS